MSDDVDEAVAARRRAEEALKEARRKTPEIRREAARSHGHLAVNHFAQLIDQTFRGTR